MKPKPAPIFETAIIAALLLIVLIIWLAFALGNIYFIY